MGEIWLLVHLLHLTEAGLGTHRRWAGEALEQVGLRHHDLWLAQVLLGVEEHLAGD